jgi:hypothetical protein
VPFLEDHRALWRSTEAARIATRFMITRIIKNAIFGYQPAAPRACAAGQAFIDPAR